MRSCCAELARQVITDFIEDGLPQSFHDGLVGKNGRDAFVERNINQNAGGSGRPVDPPIAKHLFGTRPDHFPHQATGREPVT